ncbi:hypothetical protein CONLIGDRAFT_271613 [Coniochaeta ligniaria NRRL 30616]|uniref:Pre-mRNA-splicing factor CWC26 n=1 Tax=Coniochaeta ligniaria NRRL 30616 TaxID=1408157 RepID=A0A1J7JGK5_9PEZI|nr:hypothetical protein CONLIGDRAFT_271613 [Coniochaeta ligniaria NRRL 30616]
MPDLNSYLAAHYLTADPKPSSKKRKRKTPKSQATGLLIADDDEAGWTKPHGSDSDDELQNAATAVAGTSAEFRRAKKSAWKTVGSGGVKKNDEADEADAVLASAAAESAAAAGRAAEDEAPAVADGDGDVKMSDGTLAGLQSAKDVAAQLARRREEEMEEEDEEDQVVLRDATGRRVDVSMARAEARRNAAEAEEKGRREEEARRRALKGDVQLEEARRRREALEDAALMPLARGKDDEELNREMKAARRWNDPMAQFLGDDEPPPAVVGGKGKTGGKGSGGRRPVYKGAAPPNRYGIRPGYRWDGVDRGNGFEAERFKALNRRERNKGLEYAWQMDE